MLNATGQAEPSARYAPEAERDAPPTTPAEKAEVGAEKAERRTMAQAGRSGTLAGGADCVHCTGTVLRRCYILRSCARPLLLGAASPSYLWRWAATVRLARQACSCRSRHQHTRKSRQYYIMAPTATESSMVTFVDWEDRRSFCAHNLVK